MRGSGARYIQPRGRWKSGCSAPSSTSSQASSSPIRPLAPSAPMRASPTLSQWRPPLAGSGAVSFAARGPAGSKSVNQSEPFGASPGRLWTV